MAAKAIEQLRLRVHGKRRRFFVVKWAETPTAVALGLEADILGDNLLDAEARAQLIQPGV